MSIVFDYYLGEFVHFNGHNTSLRTAITDYCDKRGAVPASHLMALAWFRDKGRTPSFFDAGHMKQLARLEEFKTR